MHRPPQYAMRAFQDGCDGFSPSLVVIDNFFSQHFSFHAAHFLSRWLLGTLQMTPPHHGGRLCSVVIAIAEEAVQTEHQMRAGLVIGIAWCESTIFRKSANRNQPCVVGRRRIRKNDLAGSRVNAVCANQNGPRFSRTISESCDNVIISRNDRLKPLRIVNGNLLSLQLVQQRSVQ